MDPHVIAMGVEVYGMYCLQRLTNAKQHFPLFYIMVRNIRDSLLN